MGVKRKTQQNQTKTKEKTTSPPTNKKTKQANREEKQDNRPGTDHSSYAEWEHERGFALT